MLDGPLFLLCLGDCSILLGLNVWFLIILSDLECDYINASSACNQLNSYILPEIVVQAIGMIFLTVNWHWILFALNIPLLAYQVLKFINVPSGSIGVFDPAEIHNQRRLKGFMHTMLVKLAFHLVFFFIYLYSMIFAFLSA